MGAQASSSLAWFSVASRCCRPSSLAAVDGQRAHRHRTRRLQPKAQGFDAGLREQRKLVDLGEIVVLAGQPEDGNVLAAAGFGGVLRLANRGRGLQQRQQRASKQDDLLAGDDGGGALLQALDICEDRLARAEVLRLRPQRFGEAAAVRGVQGRRMAGPVHGKRIRRIPAPQGRRAAAPRAVSAKSRKSGVVPGSVEMG